jgi:ABC transporter, ATP-binding protein
MQTNSLDILFIGSSHSYCAFNPKVFDHYLKCNSFNLRTSAQAFSVTYSGVVEILKKQNPKIIVLEVYALLRLPEAQFVRLHYDNMPLSINKLNLLKNTSKVSERWQFLNSLYYHVNWKNFINKYKKYKNRDIEYNYYNRLNYKGFIGYREIPYIKGTVQYELYEKGYKNNQYPEEKGDYSKVYYGNFYDNYVDVSPLYLNLFEDLLKKLKEKNIKLILVSPPVINEPRIYAVLNNPKIKRLIKLYNVDVIDFNNGERKYEKIHFLDNGHLSLSGSDIISFEVAKYLKKNYLNLIDNKNYDSNKTVEYYFYGDGEKENNYFKKVDVNLILDNNIHIDFIYFYKVNDKVFDLYFHIKESGEDLYKIALDSKEEKVRLGDLNFEFMTKYIKNENSNEGTLIYPKYYIREIAGEKYIYIQRFPIKTDSIYYF